MKVIQSNPYSPLRKRVITWDREWPHDHLWDCLGLNAQANGEFYCATKVGKNHKQVVKMHNNIILQLFIKKGNTIFWASVVFPY